MYGEVHFVCGLIHDDSLQFQFHLICITLLTKDTDRKQKFGCRFRSDVIVSRKNPLRGHDKETRLQRDGCNWVDLYTSLEFTCRVWPKMGANSAIRQALCTFSAFVTLCCEFSFF